LYLDRKVQAPLKAIGQVDGPPKDVPLEEWFAAVSQREIEQAKANGFDEKGLSGPWGSYERSLKR
jgi:hypothetical protein